MVDLPEPALRALREIVVPLLEADGAEVYIVRTPGPRLRLHLGGNCSGCPGLSTTTSQLIEPALRAVGLNEVEVTAGHLVPEGAERVFSTAS